MTPPDLPLRDSTVAFAGSTAAATRKPLMALDDALDQLLATVQPLVDQDGGCETVETLRADGRVLAQSLVSALHVPPQDNSSMDGYAVCRTDLVSASSERPVRLRVAQRIPAGHQAQPLAAGTVARIFTGAPVPAGANAIVMQEDVQVDTSQGDNLAVFIACPDEGAWIRRAGEDVSRGAEVLKPGQRLGPAELGLAASLGADRLRVCRRPRVALLSTGDELVMPGTVPPEAMPPGAIYNSNRFFLRALLVRMGCEVSDLGLVPDRRDATLQALQQAAEQHDLILTSGGVSVGEEDHIKPAVQQLGTLDLWQIAMKPGKPFAHGTVRRGGGTTAHFIGLPGNPVSSFVTFLLLVRPFLLRLQGVQSWVDPVQTLPAHFDLPRADKRREFLRVRRNPQGGLDLFPNQSSGVLTSVSWADGLVDHPAGHTIRWGDPLRFLALADWLN